MFSVPYTLAQIALFVYVFLVFNSLIFNVVGTLCR